MGLESEFRLFDFDPDQMPPEATAAIGRAVLAAIQNEELVVDAISAIARIDATALRITIMGCVASVKLEMLARWCELIVDDAVKAELREIISDLNQANARRNAICHNPLMVDAENGTLSRSQASRPKQIVKHGIVRRIDLTAAAIAEDADFIKGAGLRLNSFISRVFRR